MKKRVNYIVNLLNGEKASCIIIETTYIQITKPIAIEKKPK